MGIIRRFIDRRGEELRNRFSLTVGGGQGQHAQTRDPMRPTVAEVTPTALSVRSTLAPLSLGQQKQITVAEPVERLGAPLSYLRPDTIEMDYRHRINRGMVTVPCWALNQALTITPMLADKVRFWTNSIKQMQWKIEPVTGADAAKVTAQTEALKAAYAAQDLPATLEHLAKAPFYGFAHIAKTAPRWSLLDQWNFVRDGLYGDWFWNGDLRITNSVGLPDDARLDVSSYIIREYTDPLLLQMLGQFVDVKNIRRWWNVNMEQESKRQVVVIAGTGIANPEEFQRSSTEISGGRSGVLEGGDGETKTQVLFPPASRGLPYYENALKFADGEITKALTGGTLTMLASSGSGSFAGQAHNETLQRLMAAEALAIAQVLRDQVDVPALKAAGLLKDGESPAAQFSLSAVEQADPAAEADIVAKLWTAGLEVDVEEESARLGRKLRRIEQPAGGPSGGNDGGNDNNTAKARKPSPTGGRQAAGGNEPVKNRAAADDPRAGKLLAKARAELPLAVQKDLFHVAQSLNELYNAAGAVTGDDIAAFIAKLPDALTAHGATAESAAAWQGFISSALIDGATTDKPTPGA